VYSRRQETPLDTIGYEIEMLRFCRERLQDETAGEAHENSAYLEAFLLHFRNLVRFFSGVRPRPYDLSTAEAEVWAGRALSPSEVGLFQVAAECLDEEYYQTISKYLQHCTSLPQKEEHEWDVDGMYEELNPILKEFERRFLRATVAQNVPVQ
jgi:hypothetical protein